MGHLVAREAWGVLDLNTTEGRVFVQQDWHYTWTVEPGATPWTIAQKRHFHNTLDRQVWSVWSDRVRVRITGTNPLARHFGAQGLRLTFDIHWVLRPGQWAVHVRKMPPGSTPTTFVSNVTFATRKIELDSCDLTPHAVGNAANATRNHFRTVPHEFGHAMDNPEDEYSGGTFLPDTSSIMNIGNQLRPRHVHLITTTLAKLVPGCSFTAA